MGTWITTNTCFRSFFSDRIGYKSGLALNNREMIDLLDKNDPLIDIFKNPKEELTRIRTDHIEDAFQIMLYRLGTTPKKFIGHAPTLMGIEFMNHPSKSILFQQVLMILGKTHFSKGKDSIFDGFDEEQYYEDIHVKFGSEALEIARRLVMLTKESEEASPWGWLSARVTEWESPIELKELFESESLNAMYGKFIDQRYINYLANNTDQLSTMHWRKFEALTAEYFERTGYKVDIGSGRNDGGVDVRVWCPQSNPNDPPIQIIQCKRTKSKIDKVLVKSLWADVIDENAKGGIIVTTSSFSPGAREVCKVRKYPIREVNRKVVIQWLNDLRRVGSGVFMGE
ncbi:MULTISPECIES: restriction endonuclease [Yersinia]|uniref:Restriction endonuclease n=1 Tax=Yersinia enterocolitica TaxID=630 RepID=A0A9P1PWB1_YEREN|nr:MULTISPECIES: restriction endonuclease [Yersinia]MDA5526865.1 restriction endonuclease [Yersinia mollaretii]MDR7872260.1 restriction endonuclease [Yersinia mollaretii]PHZ31717.1 restriction endonuclease [Yersinia mollaretii]WQC73223.1 restriction endonuclease [Yersinia mollaretii]CNF88490.1 Restriction endonuclease [Yersinia enterocolitica]